MKRRKFVRTVVVGGAGAAATSLPFARVYSESPKRQSAVRTNRRHIVRGPAHLLRDGHQFPLPPPTEYRDVVIVGAGPNALVSAYHLPDIELVCLEKEPRCGGNAQRSKWRGIEFTEGTAYTSVRSRLVDFIDSEFGIAPTPIHSNVGYIVGTKIIPDFYATIYLGNLDPLHRQRKIAPRGQPVPELVYENSENELVCRASSAFTIRVSKLGYFIEWRSEFHATDRDIVFGDQEEMG